MQIRNFPNIYIKIDIDSRINDSPKNRLEIGLKKISFNKTSNLALGYYNYKVKKRYNSVVLQVFNNSDKNISEMI